MRDFELDFKNTERETPLTGEATRKIIAEIRAEGWEPFIFSKLPEFTQSIYSKDGSTAIEGGVNEGRDAHTEIRRLQNNGYEAVLVWQDEHRFILKARKSEIPKLEITKKIQEKIPHIIDPKKNEKNPID